MYLSIQWQQHSVVIAIDMHYADKAMGDAAEVREHMMSGWIL